MLGFPFTSKPTDTRRWSNVGLLLGQRRRRWPSSEPTLDQRLVFANYDGAQHIFRKLHNLFLGVCILTMKAMTLKCEFIPSIPPFLSTTSATNVNSDMAVSTHCNFKNVVPTIFLIIMWAIYPIIWRIKTVFNFLYWRNANLLFGKNTITTSVNIFSSFDLKEIIIELRQQVTWLHLQ